MSTKAIGYVRVSTDEQAEHGVSLAAQEKRLRAYCELYGVELVRVEVDAGASAKTLRRAALQRALASLRDGEADALIIAKLDRLTRRTRDLLDVVERYFADGRRALLSVHEQIDTRSAAGRMILTVLGALAQFEREQLGERTSAAMRYLAAEGRFLGGTAAPYGYALAKDGEKLVTLAAEQEVISEVRALRAAGLSLRAIAATLDERGQRARNGKRFAPAQVARMTEAA